VYASGQLPNDNATKACWVGEAQHPFDRTCMHTYLVKLLRIARIPFTIVGSRRGACSARATVCYHVCFLLYFAMCLIHSYVKEL